MRRVLILGSTGSIGTQALDVIRERRDQFEVVGLAAGRDAESLAAQAVEFEVAHEATALGADAAEQLVRDVEADVVLNGITGSVGLGPTLAALETGRTLALANKESLIVGGDLVMALAAPGLRGVAADALAAEGHSVHPLSKLRRGLSEDEIFAYSPEQGRVVDLVLLGAANLPPRIHASPAPSVEARLACPCPGE